MSTYKRADCAHDVETPFASFSNWFTGDAETWAGGPMGCYDYSWPSTVSPEAMADLEGKVALVTGAAGGIGRATTAALLAAGAYVLAFDAAEGPLEDARVSWNAGNRVRTVVGDVGEAGDIITVFNALERFNRQLVAVVTCAGIHSNALVEDLPDDEWRRILRVNLRGTFLCCRAAARGMIPQRRGAIVTMSSSLAYVGGIGRAHYAASKAAVSAFTRSLALELAPYGIRANVVAPGAIDTPMPRKLSGRTEEDVQLSLKKNPLHRIGSAQDVADLILFLLSMRSSHITGQVVHINGGELMP